MTARELMQASDQLTGVQPGMSAEEIRERVSITREESIKRYLLDLYKRSRSSAERGDIVSRLEGLVSQNPHLRSSINQALAGRVSMTVAPFGRPRKYETEKAARREASRAYRARKAQR